MKSTTRRTFMRQSTLATAASIASFSIQRTRAANKKVSLAVIGPGGLGMSYLKMFVTYPDVQIPWVCDVDSNRMAEAAGIVEKAAGAPPKTTTDLRRILEDKSVDAVLIATPDHWHAPATILACEAGKHVYVEKPCCHNIREGRLMLEAGRKHKRIVQTGHQSRSQDFLMEAVQKLRDGIIGEVLTAKAWNSQLRRTIGKVQPSDPPPHLDYDTWLGPAPHVPYKSNMVPGTWRWFYAFGTGDIGNDGVHDLDVARWGLGVKTHPTRVAALGGKFFFDDDQQWPDTQNVIYEYDAEGQRRKQLIFEQRTWSPYVQEGYENGNAFYGTQGAMLLGKQIGWKIFGPRNKLIEEKNGHFDTSRHHRNFLDCIKNGGTPNADVEIGHYSAALSHLGNIATRIGRVLNFDPKREQVVGDDEANRLVRREYRTGHWAVPKGV